MSELSLIQKEIALALEAMKEKSLITEAILAKKVRENAKILGKNKAGLCLKDIEAALENLFEQKEVSFSLHLNSANDILIKKDETFRLLESEAKKRRLSSEKSSSVLTSGDLCAKSSGGKEVKKRTDRRKLGLRDIEAYDGL